jgi:predicted nucleic acid-binding protein
MTVLADTSAWITVQRLGGATFEFFDELVESDVWTCEIVRLELLRGAPNPRAMKAMRARLDEVLNAPIDENVWQRAEEVYEGLAHFKGGRHRGVQPADVLVAAAAEANELTLLHDDTHFDLIAEVTGQEMLRLP